MFCIEIIFLYKNFLPIKNIFDSLNLKRLLIKICCDGFITKKTIKTVEIRLDKILCESH